MRVDIHELLLEGIFLTKDLTTGKEWLTTVLRLASLAGKFGTTSRVQAPSTP